MLASKRASGDDVRFIDCREYGNLLRLVNDCTEAPNCTLSYYPELHLAKGTLPRRAFLISNRKIPAGCELTWNYGKNYLRHWVDGQVPLPLEGGSVVHEGSCSVQLTASTLRDDTVGREAQQLDQAEAAEVRVPSEVSESKGGQEDGGDEDSDLDDEVLIWHGALEREVAPEGSSVETCNCCGSGASEPGNEMLLCDRPACSERGLHGWHLQCLVPPLVCVPDGEWFCPLCVLAVAGAPPIEAGSIPPEPESIAKRRLVQQGLNPRPLPFGSSGPPSTQGNRFVLADWQENPSRSKLIR